MKKITMVLLALVVLFGFIGCDSSGGDDNGGGSGGGGYTPVIYSCAVASDGSAHYFQFTLDGNILFDVSITAIKSSDPSKFTSRFPETFPGDYVELNKLSESSIVITGYGSYAEFTGTYSK